MTEPARGRVADRPALLVYNASARNRHRAGPEALVAALRDARWAVQHVPTRTPGDLNEVLRRYAGVVFVAGGDGTFREVARRVAGRSDVDIALIPMGTSNNVAGALNVTGSPLVVAQRYASSRLRSIDAGRVRAPWGEDVFFEACGYGLFADVLAAYDPEAPKSVLRGVRAVTHGLRRGRTYRPPVRIDGIPVPAGNVTLLEVMNTPTVSNGMRLAPNADVSDGFLDVVRIREDGQARPARYVAAVLHNDFSALSGSQSPRVRSVQLPYDGQVFHIDGEVRAAQPGGRGCVHVDVWPQAVRIRVPV